MTVSSQISEESYGPSAGTVLPLPFRFFNNSEISVTKVDDTTGATTVLTLGVDYTLTGAGEPEVNGNATGTVVLSAAIPAGFQYVVTRTLALEQLTDLINQGKFFPEIHESTFDRIVMMIQQLYQGTLNSLQKTVGGFFWDFLGLRAINLGDPVNGKDAANKDYVDTVSSSNSNRALRVPSPETIPALPAAAGRAGRMLSFDTLGNPQLVVPDPGSASALALLLADASDPAKGSAVIGRGLQIVTSIAALKTLLKTSPSKFAYTTSYWGDNRGGAAMYRLDIADTTTADNGVTVIVAADGGRWKLIMTSALNIEQGGAKGDGATDDTAAIQRVLDTGFTLITAMPSRTYRVTDTLVVKTNYQVLDFSMSEIGMDEATGTKTIMKVGGQASQINGVKLRQIVFTRAQACTAGYAVDFDFVGISEIRHCRVYGNNRIWRGVRFIRAIMCWMSNNYIDNCINRGTYMIGTGTGANRTVDINMLENRVEGGITALETSDFVEGLYCRENIFFNTSGVGAIHGATTNANGLISFKLQHNDYDTCGGGGLYIDMIDDVQVTGCWFSAVQVFGCSIKDNVDGCVFSGNQVFPAAIGVDVFGNNVIVSGNLMSGGTTQVNLNTQATFANVTDNTLGNSSIGVLLGATTNALVADNQGHNFSSGMISGTGGAGTQIMDNRGDSARGTGSFITVGASPFTYTAGPRPEYVSINSGTVSQIALGANAIGFTTNRSVILAPGQSVTVTYSSVPFMVKNLL